MKIGVLALQGSFAEHVATLRRLGVEAVEVRLPSQLEDLDGLIIPGGESTTIGKLLDSYGFLEQLRPRISAGFPVYGTCAGLILLARDVGGLDQPLLATMDLVVDRNAYGRQIDSFEADVPIAGIGSEPFHAIFIRAPKIKAVGPDVEVLGTHSDGGIVAARQGNLLVSAFHPELTDDSRFHQYFVDLCAANREARARRASVGSHE
ncbi:MAG: pyridoxal 5'-phosphate synthase glutaminase subunit PdxT [Chloroflexi bacterium]|nr:pyridoxal 5'-phosphate synthase glutaminase subunit PdxT [Chloroflexota bacterium]